MGSIYKFKVSCEKYLYAIYHIKAKSFQKIFIPPDGADYILFTKKSFMIIKKQNYLQTIKVQNDDFVIILRLKPYILKLITQNKNYLQQLEKLGRTILFTHSISVQKSIFDHFFRSQIVLDQKTKELIHIIEEIHLFQGQISVQDLAKKFDIVPRTFQRMFNKYIGIPPKEYIDIIKFQSTLTRINKIKLTKTVRTPQSYTDYSHLYKTYKKYVGVSPIFYLKSQVNDFGSIFD